MKLRNILAGAGVLAALAFASAASATTVNMGTLSASTPLSASVTAHGTVDDTFNFNIQPPPLTTYGQFIDFFVQGKNGKLLSDVFSSGTISLFDSTNTLLDQVGILSAPGAGSTTVTDVMNLGVGDYHFEVNGTIASSSPGNYTFGVFGAAVPEPAAWGMMIMGLGLIGSTLRVRARREQGVAA